MNSAFILLPLLLLIAVNAPKRSVFISHFAFWSAVGLFLLQVFFVALNPVLFWNVYPDPFGPFFSFGLVADTLTLITLFCIGLVAFVSLLVGRTFIREEAKFFYFTNLVLISVMGMNAIALSTDIFSLYVFIEVTAVASFLLIALFKDKLGIEASFKYVMLSALASVFMLSAIGLFVLTVGGVSFTLLYGALSSFSGNFLLQLAVLLFISGLLIKSGVVPFHGWLPDSYTAASIPVAILLAGAVTKLCGVYVLLRLFVSVFPFNEQLANVLMGLGIVSIIVGALCALSQNNFKRLLAYSSISQIGYILLGIGCGVPLALAGAAFHFLNHTIFKSLLFVNAAALEKKFGSTDIDRISGELPVTNVTSTCAFLSAGGVPPFSGFWSKLMIIVALWQAGRFNYAAIALLASLLTIAYFLYFQRVVFFKNQAEGTLDNQNAPGFTLNALQVVLALITIGLGVGFPLIMNTWIMPLLGIVR